ncbi:MAG: DUF2723 domain-containing protein, partial [Muribaculaceae bacterium]|nr:DUF2723 domain-containing protein [Muribaculaceae bacterium]
VFWLILKWEDRADDPKSDRWFILIAYVFGISLGVHLLNLLCLPAIALVVYYRKVKKSKVTGSLLTLLISFMMIVFILYGLEPGFVKWGGLYELFFTNTLGMPFNTGVVLYVITMIALFAWCIFELKRGKNDVMIKISFILCIFFSGMFFLGSGVLGIIITLLLLGCLVYFLFVKDKITTRLISNVVLCTFMIFLGFTSYGVILIRSNANTPLDENSPNSPFALTSYLSRDQYGKSPLFYGRVFTSQPLYVVNDDGHTVSPKTSEGRNIYSRKVKANADEPDKYILTGVDEDIKYTPELNMIFPRIYDNLKANGYREWITPQDVPDYVEGTLIEFPNGTVAQTQSMESPSFGDNLEYFFKYQLNHMYFRYFMWNFAGRQNDIQGNGEITQGNWISGIPFIDNARLGDQSLLPEDYTTGNKGHNVFYCLPLLLGLLGLLWQSFSGKKGIQQFWVIFFLFFMTGIAIVLYLNQPPGQPRERDYAYAGSFYAFAIWIGMGVAAIWKICLYFIKNFKAKQKDDEKTERSTASLAVAGVAAVIGLAVPLQMVSQTWDDHDRSGRYCARDFGMNYLASVDKDAIIFTNGDNDTFPLWYLQEVEGYRTDVRVVNLSYLATDWYIAQMRRASYDSKPLPMLANDNTFAYTDRQINYFTETADSEAIDLLECLEQLYTDSSNVD